jgi:hypothetical protein
MLSSLLTAVQGALTNAPRGFLIASFLPVLTFLVANFWLLAVLEISWAKTYVTKVEQLADKGATQSVLASFAIVAAVGLLATFLAALQPVLLRLLEGEGLPRSFAAELHRCQVSRRDRLRDCAERAFLAKETFARLRSAAENLPALPTGGRDPARATIDSVRELERQRCLGEAVLPESLESAIAALDAATQVPGHHRTPPKLDELIASVSRVAGYAQERANHTYYAAERALQTWFPGDVFDRTPSSDNVLAPTTLGNIARTMRTYALRRYSMDLDIFWSRLQKVIADNGGSKMYDALQAQKAQLDCFVGLFFLTALTGILWLPPLAAAHVHGFAFSMLATVVPAGCWILYHAACRTYLVFADQVRTAVDFFRLDVLSGYKLALPMGTREEERLWFRLGNRVGYANDGETFTYARQQR